MSKFKCSNCGGHELSYEKWISSCSPVKIYDNGYMEYKQAVIDEDDDLGGADGFVCMECKHELHLCGCRIQNENELKSYLSLDPDNRKEQERLYQESVEEEARIEKRSQESEIEYYLSRSDRYLDEE